MNAELPHFKNGKHNSKSASTIDRGLAPLRRIILEEKRSHAHMFAFTCWAVVTYLSQIKPNCYCCHTVYCTPMYLKQ